MPKQSLRDRLLDIRDDMIDELDEHLESRNEHEPRPEPLASLYTRGFGDASKPTSGKQAGRNKDVLQPPPLPMPRRSRCIVLAVEVFATCLFYAILAVPVSRYAAERFKPDSGDPDRLWRGTEGVSDFGVIVAIFAVLFALSAAYRIGDMIGTTLSISQRSLMLLFTLATVTGFYTFWASRVVHTQVEASVGMDVPGGFSYEVTWQLVALGVLASASQALRRFAGILRGPSGPEQHVRAVVGVAVAGAVVFFGRSWVDQMPPISGIAVPVM